MWKWLSDSNREPDMTNSNYRHVANFHSRRRKLKIALCDIIIRLKIQLNTINSNITNVSFQEKFYQGNIAQTKIHKSSKITWSIREESVSNRGEPPIDAKLHPYKQSRAGSVEGWACMMAANSNPVPLSRVKIIMSFLLWARHSVFFPSWGTVRKRRPPKVRERNVAKRKEEEEKKK